MARFHAFYVWLAIFAIIAPKIIKGYSMIDIKCGDMITGNINRYETKNYTFTITKKEFAGIFSTCLNITSFDTYLKIYDDSDTLIQYCMFVIYIMYFIYFDSISLWLCDKKTYLTEVF